MAAPTPKDQVEFLRNIQRVLEEGQFVASYKFALLRALADLAVQKGDDSGGELELTVAEIGERFIELYWRQARPFSGPGAGEGAILRQSTQSTASILRCVAGAYGESEGSLARLRAQPTAWGEIVAEVAGTVAAEPLWKLQRVGEDVADFLYPNVGRGRTIRLRPGIAYCLRNFYGILRPLIEGAWIAFVRRRNLDTLGHASDIGDFLFNAERASLEPYRGPLRDLQRGACFYCGATLRVAGDVDHFIPWSRYPADLGPNFVLAHRACNAAKGDHLAAERHLAAWTERNNRHERDLARLLAGAPVASSLGATLGIARWAYEQAAGASARVWLEGNVLDHLTGEWARLLRVA